MTTAEKSASWFSKSVSWLLLMLFTICSRNPKTMYEEYESEKRAQSKQFKIQLLGAAIGCIIPLLSNLLTGQYVHLLFPFDFIVLIYFINEVGFRSGVIKVREKQEGPELLDRKDIAGILLLWTDGDFDKEFFRLLTRTERPIQLATFLTKVRAMFLQKYAPKLASYKLIMFATGIVASKWVVAFGIAVELALVAILLVILVFEFYILYMVGCAATRYYADKIAIVGT